MTIESACDAHLPAVLELLETSGLPLEGVPEGWANWVVAHVGGRIVGCAGLEVYAEAGLMRSVAVASSHRGQRIAAQLVEQLLARAKELALDRVYLLTTGAQAYFERHGFIRVPRHSVTGSIADSWEFRCGCPATATVMARSPIVPGTHVPES